MSNRRWIALLLIALAALSWWLQRSVEPASQQAFEQMQHEPDYYMDEFESTALNLEGKPAHKLYADSLKHYANDDSATLERPHLVVFRSEDEFWDIRAESGQILNGGETVLLQGEVIILRITATDTEALQIYTADLTVHPYAKYMETAAAVNIKDGRGRTTAIGMSADLSQRRVALLSAVRGTYEPQSH
ncbi:MAG: LPS export ABC transporter periplasmic protein LptC [Gammaproteobacteria bacterium]|nr:LPS export ABC transporter periplasmic protein LptC [Gammaproteobacteria bacterium]